MADSPSTDKPDEKETASVSHWNNELRQAKKRFNKFHDQAEEANKRYLDDDADDAAVLAGRAPKRLSLFHSNVNVLRANLFAQIPQAEADRRFFDPKDDVARVAAEMVTRIINNDLNNPQDQSKEVLKAALQDKLISGLGVLRYRYKMTEKEKEGITPESLAAEYPNGVPEDYKIPMVKASEQCEPVYTYWRDILWGPCRVWGPDWVAFRAYMTKAEVEERFGDKIAMVVPYGTQRDSANPGASDFNEYDSVKRVTPEAEIWEIWDRTSKRTLWKAEGFDRFLDQKSDILDIPGFFPNPKPLISNATSAKFIPKPSYTINRGLYREIDELETRIGYLTRACKAVGVYDSANTEIKRVMQEGVENELIPAANWAIFMERGGFKGVVDWVPIEANAAALKICAEQQLSRIEQLYQVEGLSDIMRGQASKPATAAEQKIKAQFASVRLQFQQDEFAEFVSDSQNIKVAMIRSLYDEATIIKLSNADALPEVDRAHVPAAIKLIKNTKEFNVRVVVTADSLIQKNMEAIKGERTELLQGIAQFLGMAQQLLATNPDAAPFIYQLLQFGISAFDGASEMEGLFDAYIQKMEEALEQAKKNPPKPPAVVEAEAKAQAQIATEGAKAQGAVQVEQARGATEAAIAQAEGATQVQVKQAEGEIEVRIEVEKAKIAADLERTRMEIEERSKEADRQLEREQIAAENQRHAAKIASEEAIAAADRLSKETLEREKIQSQERVAEKAAQAAKEKPIGGGGAA